MRAPWVEHCIIWGVALALGVAGWFYLGQRTPDFTVFYAAATGWPGPVYDPAYIAAVQGKQDYPWAYPPTFLLMVLPLRLMGLKLAYAVWTAVSTGLFLEGARTVVGRWSPLLVLSPVFFLAAVNGQSTLLIAALAAAALAMPHRPLAAGVLLGLAACIKPQLVLPLAPLGLLVAGRWRQLVATGATGLGLCFASALVFGPDIWRQWIEALPVFSAQNARMGLPGIAPEPPALRAALAAVSVGLTVFAFRRDDRALQALIAFGAPLTFSAHMMSYDALLILPAAFAMAMRSPWWAPLHAFLLLRFVVSWGPILTYLALSTLQSLGVERRVRGIWTARRSAASAEEP